MLSMLKALSSSPAAKESEPPAYGSRGLDPQEKRTFKKIPQFSRLHSRISPPRMPKWGNIVSALGILTLKPPRSLVQGHI